MTFSASQQIVVGSGAIVNNSNSTTTTTSPGDTSSGSTNTVTVYVNSAHSSPAPLSNTENKMEFEISAGRDRLASVGSPILFKAVPAKLQNVSETGIIYEWSFGDGTRGVGSSPTHSYRFPGEYVVVTNASYSDKQAVSRLTVRVVSPVFSLARVSEGIEISNKSGVEINLEDWNLVSLKKTFTFPKDTLIPAGKKVIFADEITGLNSDSLELVNPMKKSFVTLSPEISLDLVSTVSPNLENIQAKIDEVKTTLAKISPIQKAVTPIVKITQPSIILTLESPTPQATTSVRENVATVFEATKQTGLVSTLFSWPIKGFNFIRHLFVEE